MFIKVQNEIGNIGFIAVSEIESVMELRLEDETLSKCITVSTKSGLLYAIYGKAINEFMEEIKNATA